MSNIGTSISDLYDKNRNDIINNSNVPNFMNKDESVDRMAFKSNVDNNSSINDQLNMINDNKSNIKIKVKNIKHLVNDINNNLDDEFDIDDLYDDTVENIDEPVNDNIIKKIFIKLYDPAILLLIYIILSQNGVRITIGKYISYINSNEKGIISTTGIIIYGIIMITLYKCCIYAMNSKF